MAERETGERREEAFLPSPQLPLGFSFFFSLASPDFLARVTILRDCSQSTLGLDEEKKI